MRKGSAGSVRFFLGPLASSRLLAAFARARTLKEPAGGQRSQEVRSEVE